MEVTFSDKCLTRGNKVIKTFEFPIKQVLELDEVILVRLNVPPKSNYNENVFCLDRAGNLNWVVPKYSYDYEDSPFIDMTIEENKSIKLWNWDSSYIVIEPKTGVVLISPRESRKGRRAW